MSEWRLKELEAAVVSTKIEILGLSEIRRQGELIQERVSGYIFFHFGKTSGQRGVGFIILKSIKEYIEEFTGISDRIERHKLKMGKKRVVILQVYAPTSASSEEEIEIFYKSLGEIISITEVNHQNYLIIMGDFNSQAGANLCKEEIALGPFGFPKLRNERGEKLKNFCHEYCLKIINSFFKKRSGKKWTWITPNR